MLTAIVVVISLSVMPIYYSIENYTTSNSLTVKDSSVSYNFSGPFYDINISHDALALEPITSTTNITQSEFTTSTFSLTLNGYCMHDSTAGADELLVNVTVIGNISPNLNVKSVSFFQNESGAAKYLDNHSTTQTTMLLLLPYFSLNNNVSIADQNLPALPAYSKDSSLNYTVGLVNNTNLRGNSGEMYHFEWFSQVRFEMNYLNITHHLLFHVFLNGLNKVIYSSILLNVTDTVNIGGIK